MKPTDRTDNSDQLPPARDRGQKLMEAKVAEAPTAMSIDKRNIVWTVVLLFALVPLAIGLLFGWGLALMGWFVGGLWALCAASIKSPASGFWVLVALVVLAPLPLGSVHSWSWGLMACVVGVLLAAWSGRVILGLEHPAIGLKTAWPFVGLFGAAVLWVMVQSLSVTPADWHHPMWRSAADALGMDLASSVSLNPYETLSILCRLLTYAGIFWLSLQYCRRSSRARQVIYAVTYAGLAYTVYGLAVQFSGSQTILWFDKFAYLHDLTASFVNRNSFATYAGLALMCATGLIVMVISSTVNAPLSLKERVRQLIENMTGRGWSLLVAWIVIVTALILSHSRAGFLSTLLGLAALITVLSLTRVLTGRYTAIFGALCFVMLGVFFAVGGGALDQRIAETTMTEEPRLRVYELTLSAIDTAPMLGTGAGTFEEVFRFYRTSDIYQFYMKAHSTYLENILEFGYPAALALFGVFVGFIVLTYLGLRRRRRDMTYPCIGFASTILVAAHSIVDFSLQIPAVTATYCLIMGAACAQCWSTRKPEDPW